MAMQRSVVYSSFSRDLTNSEAFRPVLCNQAVVFQPTRIYGLFGAFAEFRPREKIQSVHQDYPQVFSVNQMTEYRYAKANDQTIEVGRSSGSSGKAGGERVGHPARRRLSR